MIEANTNPINPKNKVFEGLIIWNHLLALLFVVYHYFCINWQDELIGTMQYRLFIKLKLKFGDTLKTKTAQI